MATVSPLEEIIILSDAFSQMTFQPKALIVAPERQQPTIVYECDCGTCCKNAACDECHNWYSNE